MSPLPAILHLAAAAAGVWLGFVLVEAIGAPEGTGAAARSAQEAAVVDEVEQAVRSAEEQERAARHEKVEGCKAGARSADGLPPGVRRELLRRCAEDSVFAATAHCPRVVVELVDPASPAWRGANAACVAIEEP